MYKCDCQARKESQLMYTYVRGNNFTIFSTIFLLHLGIVLTVWFFSIIFWDCSDSVVFFYYILELFRQCGIFLLHFRIVPTVWYFFVFHFTYV